MIVGLLEVVGGADSSVGDRTSCRASIAGGPVEGGDGDALRFCHTCSCCSDIIMAMGMAAAGLRLEVGVRVGLNEAVGLGDADGAVEIDGIAEMEGEEDSIKVVDDVVAGVVVVVVLLSDVHGD